MPLSIARRKEETIENRPTDSASTESQPLQHKLAAILYADVAGYSRLTGEDEAGTHRTLSAYLDLFAETIRGHRGEVKHYAGDAVLADFSTVSDALNCAVAVQRELKQRNDGLPEAKRAQFRIGLNLGEVIVDRGEVYGNGVNVAARLETLAEPGGICVSGNVVDAVGAKLPLSYEYRGEHRVKNIDKPVRAYRVTEARQGVSWQRSPFLLLKRLASTRARRFVFAGLAVLIVAAAVAWRFSPIEFQREDPILALPKGPAIAVLPFTNLGGDPAQEYFSDGLTEDLITGLSRFPDLLVIGRNTTSQYKGQAVDIRKVGRELGARYVVEGSVRRAAKTVRVTSQLLDARDGKHLWAETFDRELSVGELFAVQDEITAQIIGAIAGSYGVIPRTRHEAAVVAGTTNLEAYDCVLQAYAYEHILSPEIHAATRDCLERAVKLDPAYAAAWSKLAFLYADEYAWGYNPRPGSLDRALEAAQRAVELNPSSGMTHWHLARTHFWRNEVEDALAAAERALALSSNNAFVLAAAGAYMAPTGGDNLKRGMQLASKALRIDPNAPGWYHVPEILFHYDRREYEAALAACLKMNMPKFFMTYVYRTAIYGQLRRSADALASRDKLLQLYPTFAKNARHELEKFNVNRALADHIIDGLRKAGLDIPPA